MDLSGVGGILLFVAAIAISIIIGNKTKINIGLVAFAFTFVIGYFLCGFSSKVICGLFPSSIFLNQVSATAFFGYMTANGTFQNIAGRLVYKAKNRPEIIPILLALVTALIAWMGAGATANVVMTSICFAIIGQAGFDPQLASICSWGLATATIGAPWTQGGSNVQKIFGEYMSEGDTTKMMFTLLFLFTIVVFCYIVGFTLFDKKRREKRSGGAKIELQFDKPEPLNKKQKQTLVVLVCFLLLMVVPSIGKLLAPKFTPFKWISARFDIYSICLCGCIIMQFLNVADGKDVVKTKIPWGSLVMVTGMASLVALAAKCGVIDTICGWASGNFSARWLPLVMCFIGGALSYVTTASSVIYPTFAPVLPTLAAAVGCSPVALGVALMAGANATSLSPVSGGGAQSLVGATEEQREQIGVRQFAHAIYIWIIFLVLGALGFYNLF